MPGSAELVVETALAPCPSPWYLGPCAPSTVETSALPRHARARRARTSGRLGLLLQTQISLCVGGQKVLGRKNVVVFLINRVKNSIVVLYFLVTFIKE